MPSSFTLSLRARMIQHEQDTGNKPVAMYVKLSIWRELRKEWLDTANKSTEAEAENAFQGVPIFVLDDGLNPHHPAVKIL